MKNAVAYIRVSTQKQGRSGLGLEAQQASIARFAAAEGYEITQTFVEIETGKGADALDQRPQLAAALKAGGVVIVAKLDRLTRDVHFGSGLMSRKVAFKVAEMPHADNFQLHLFLALAEQEREVISARTKAALQAAKERGQKLGSPTSPAILRDRSSAFAEGLRAIVAPIAHLTSRQIAEQLNAQNVLTATGGLWQSMTVCRLLDRLNLNAKVAA
jgi:DNA invertase Pin-like site-specific DNA recombinase